VYVGDTVPRLDTVVRDGPHGALLIGSEAQLNMFRASCPPEAVDALLPQPAEPLYTL